MIFDISNDKRMRLVRKEGKLTLKINLKKNGKNTATPGGTEPDSTGINESLFSDDLKNLLNNLKAL
jgi:hypothetical protein